MVKQLMMVMMWLYRLSPEVAVETYLGPEVAVEAGLGLKVDVDDDELDDSSDFDFNTNTKDNHSKDESHDPDATN